MVALNRDDIIFSVFCIKLITWIRPSLPLSLLPPSLRGELKLARLRPPLACERRPRLPLPTYTHVYIWKLFTSIAYALHMQHPRGRAPRSMSTQSKRNTDHNTV